MSLEHARARARRLQERICGDGRLTVGSVETLYDQLKATLMGGVHSEHLINPPYQISELLKRVGNPLGRGSAEGIVGGQKDFRRDREEGWFRRNDGARFNFSVAVDAGPPVILIAYDFEIVFADGTRPPFVRFDLNPPWHENAMRCHFHPGNDDLMAPSPRMTPLEILELLLYELRFPTDRSARQ